MFEACKRYVQALSAVAQRVQVSLLLLGDSLSLVYAVESAAMRTRQIGCVVSKCCPQNSMLAQSPQQQLCSPSS
jgi:hypothetical protein